MSECVMSESVGAREMCMRKAVTRNTLEWITTSHVQLGMRIDMCGVTHIMGDALMWCVSHHQLPTARI